jgi:hypothetical protein
LTEIARILALGCLDWSNDWQGREGIPRRRFVEGLLPNVLPLPRKSIPKQDEPTAIMMGYVIEIEGTI